MKHPKRVIAMVTGLLLVAGASATAWASLPSGTITSTIYVDRAKADDSLFLNSDHVKFQTKGATDVRVQSLTYEPGSASGWHFHPGFVLVTVQSGTITMWMADCNTMTYGPGSVFVETGTQTGQLSNQSGAPATIYATFVVPDGAPFRVETDPPACAL